jgi:hypothetical protein
MKRWIVAGVAVGHAFRLGVVEAVADLAKTTIHAVRSWVAGAWRWHQRRMISDPAYPVALLAIAKAFVRISVPQAGIAAALVALMAEFLTESPWLGSEADDWDDQY